MNLTRKRGFAAFMVAALIAVGVVSTSPSMAASATNTPTQCVVDIIHHEAQSKYSKTEPEVSHVENKYRQTGTVYTIEHKVTGLTNDATTNASIISWYGTIGAVYDSGYDKWQLPDALVNAAGVNPFAVAQSGNVNLVFYGYPGNAVVPYEITDIEVFSSPPPGSLFYTVDNITLYYTGPGNTPSTDSGDAVWSATDPGSPWVTFGSSRTVVDSPAKIVYYVSGGGQTDTNTDANWVPVSEVPGIPWTKIDGEEKAAYDEEVYGPCPPTNEECIAYTSLEVTSLAQIDLTQSRTQGSSKLVPGANHVKTFNDDDNNQPGGNDQRKAAGYIDVPDFPLTQTGTLDIDFTGTGLGVGGQILLDLDGDSSNNTLILDGEAGDSIGVFEPSFYGQNVWLAAIQPGLDVSGPNVPHVGGGGGSINGSIDDYLKEWPDAKGVALGYSQGSGPAGDNLLTLIQGGCVQVTFDIPLDPAKETKQEVVEGQPDCTTHTVEGTITTYERVRVWDEDSQEHVWGPWTPTGTTPFSRSATALECPTTVTAVDPGVKAAVCTTPTTPGLASYTVPSTTGVEYFKNGSLTPIAAGTYTAAANETVTLTAKAVDATFVLSNPDWTWSKTFPGIVCVLQLPMTGTDITVMVLLVLGLGVAGIVMIRRGRRGYTA